MEKKNLKKQWSFNKLLEESLTYGYRREWMKYSQGYNQIRKDEELISILTFHMESYQKEWTKDDCIKDCIQHKSLTQWKEKSRCIYDWSKKMGYFEECCKSIGTAPKTPSGYWSYERCREDALKYTYIAQWAKASPSAYNASHKNGWVRKITKHMMTTSEIISLQHTKWTKERCLEMGKLYTKKIDWQKKSNGSYYAASANGWLEECCSHMEVIVGKWNDKQRCIEDAKKYKTRSLWNIHSPGAYQRATYHGWREECCAHMPRYRNLEDCKKNALKYKSKEQWLINDSGFYWAAFSHDGWFKQCCKHMPEHATCELREKKAVTKFIKQLRKEVSKKIKREKMIGRFNFPDIVIEVDDKIFVLEVKHDSSRWSKKDLEFQKNKYKVAAKKQFKRKFAGCFICSPKGKYGLSFNEVIEKLTRSTTT